MKNRDDTSHLLRSPKNAERLLRALEQAQRGEGKPTTVAELRRDLGLDDCTPTRSGSKKS
jgi:antitoxin YefM